MHIVVIFLEIWSQKVNCPYGFLFFFLLHCTLARLVAKNLWKWVKKVGGARGFLDSNLMVSFRPSSTLKVGRQRHEIRDIIMTTLDLEQSKIEQISHFFDRVRLCVSYN